MKLAYTINEVQEICNIGRTKIYELINSNKLPTRKLGTKTLVLKSDLEDFLSKLPPYPTKEGGRDE